MKSPLKLSKNKIYISAHYRNAGWVYLCEGDKKKKKRIAAYIKTGDIGKDAENWFGIEDLDRWNDIIHYFVQINKPPRL